MTAVSSTPLQLPRFVRIVVIAGPPTAALVTLVCAGAGLIPALPAMAAAAALTAAVGTTRLVRLALRIHARVHSFGPCRGAGYLGLGVLATGLSVVLLPFAPPDAREPITTVGLAFAAVLSVIGLLLLPGAATTTHARLRRVFDGASLGISIAFAVWLLPPNGGMPPSALAAALIGSFGLATATVIVLRVVSYRRAAWLCGSGVGLAIGGVGALAIILAYQAPAWVLLIAAAPVVVSPALVLAGAARTESGVEPAPVGEPESHLSAYPLLTIPAAVATLAAAWHLITVGEFDRTSIVLGLSVIPTVVAREVFAVSDVRRYAKRLSTQEAHFRSLVSGAGDLTMVVGEDLRVAWQSPAAARLFGLSDADVVGRPFPDLMHPEDADDVLSVLNQVLADKDGGEGARPALVPARLRDGHGTWRDTESTVSDQRGIPEVAALVVHIRDVGERRHLERTLHKLAFTDQLTGLANRRELMRTIATQRSVEGHTGALLVIDLHGLAGVNDNRGREVGDAVLIEVGRRLRATVGSDDVAARLAGDEFAVVTVEGPVVAYALGTRLLTALTEPYLLPGATVHIYVSVGLAELAGGDGVDDVLRRADLARRRAGQLGRNRIEWYDAYLEEQLVRRMDLERELPGAASRGELDLVYQPVLGLHDGQPVGAEALLRWRSPALGTVLPSELLPVAEDLGVIGEIGQWVLQQSCRQLASWDPRLWLSVNVSPIELAAPDFVSQVAATLVTNRLAPERLVIEIAEGRVGADTPTVVTQLAGLRALGVRTALDDFGAAQASLAHLRRLPIDILKVDRALVGEQGTRQNGGIAKPLIDVVVSVGRRLGMEIIAEGLESGAQIEQARAAGCQLGQGFALAHPAPAERFEAFLAERLTQPN
ncbi:PAS domain S-box-containing protein/diguanylate cyclase (GGDEF)-like protein [Asanoa ferruginea]|uniref:PAS domain S-box-containing protein/diguanylate cyclase (GGDEF)-like protein n=1 Tax=Asanoa ferruginea TaxID=53367 RepID=A0A3D9ZM92_9ACTN|nr:PAS domain S-box-containing protein/diguanylate cyclase (GGDEF)-like protein [Asanoa ferruginea]